MSDGGDELEDAPEPVDDLLVLGVLFLPALFVWFLLRRRYAPEIRIGATIYAVMVAAGLAVTLWTMIVR